MAGEIFAPQEFALFRRDDARVIEIGALALRLQCVTLPTFGYTMLANMMMQTTAQTFRASVVALARQGLFFLPLILILPLFWQLTGIQLAQPIADAMTFVLALVLQTGLLRKISRMAERPDAPGASSEKDE